MSADRSGRPIRVAGSAVLQVTVQAPDSRESGQQPWRTPWQLGQRLTGGWSTLCEVRFAGSFEHDNSFAVGVVLLAVGVRNSWVLLIEVLR